MKPVCLAAGVIYPGYRSFKAIESPQEGDDKQWLTYWIIFAMFTVVEFFMEFMLAWVPFYYVVRRPGGRCGGGRGGDTWHVLIGRSPGPTGTPRIEAHRLLCTSRSSVPRQSTSSEV